VPDRPTRFKRPTLLIVGCGDAGLRVAALLAGRWRIVALTSSPARLPALRAAGIVPLTGDLDRPATLARLADLADAVLHLAPPAAEGNRDARTARLVHALARSRRLRRLVYASTSGVYGDCAGERVGETRPLRPASDRARRRADAEARVRWLGRASGIAVTILRIPGIYALDRAGGDPRERVRRGTPLLTVEDDVFTSHIHADDLARACIAALHRGPRQRALNVADDSELKMADYFEYVADRFALPPPPRLARAEVARILSPLQMSFLGESRRLANARMKAELRLVLRYPTIVEGLASVSREPRREGE
jgi:nucleoside-diphosphate-sugar epimerase